MKLALVTPWASPFIWTRFCQNVADMLCGFHRPGWELRFFMGRGVDPAARHIDMIQQGLDWGADLVCIVGADQVHPHDMLDRLVTRYYETGGGVISALVPFRGYVSWQDMRPFQPMGWRLGGEGVQHVGSPQETPKMWTPIDPADGDLQRVDVIGSGVLLFDRETVEALAKPWFYLVVDPETHQRIADTDTKFVWRLRSEVQAQVWVDTTIKVRHLHTFEIDDSFQYRFDDWMEAEGSTDEIFRYQARAGEEQSI